MSLTNRNIYEKPATPSLGAAGYEWNDVTFGSLCHRVTDANFTADIGGTNQSFRTSASSYQREWNADGTKLVINDNSGQNFGVSVNRTTLATARIGNAALACTGDMCWDSSNPNYLYTVGLQANHHTLIRLDFATTPPTSTVLLDLDTITGGMDDTAYVGSLQVHSGVLMVIYGSIQDAHMHCLWYPLADPGAKKVINTVTDARLQLTPTFGGMHSAQLDKSGRYAELISGVSAAPGGFQVWIWDTTDDVIRGGPSNGHENAGWGNRIEEGTIGTYDPMQWVLTPSLSAPTANRVELINPILTPTRVYGADHLSWNNALSGSMQPFVTAPYRFNVGPDDSPQDVTAWRAWDEELIKVATDGSGVVTRYMHTHAPVYWVAGVEDVGVRYLWFWYTPRANVNMQGDMAVITTNWDRSLGQEAGGVGLRRTDVILVSLTEAGAPPATHHRSGRFHG